MHGISVGETRERSRRCESGINMVIYCECGSGCAVCRYRYSRTVTLGWAEGVFGHFICYRGADKSLARPTSRCILFDG